MHEVLVNRLGGLSLPRKSVVRLTDRPDMTLDVYRGRKTTTQQFILHSCKILIGLVSTQVASKLNGSLSGEATGKISSLPLFSKGFTL